MGSEPSLRFSLRAEGTLNQEALKQFNINIINMRVIFVHSPSAQSGSGYSETKVEKFKTLVFGLCGTMCLDTTLPFFSVHVVNNEVD